MKKILALAAALYALVASSAYASVIGARTVGYTFIQDGHRISIDALSPRLDERLRKNIEIVQIDGGKPQFAKVLDSGSIIPDTSMMFAGAAVFNGAPANIAAVNAGSSGNITCAQVGTVVTCDLISAPSVTSLTASGNITGGSMTDSGLTASNCVGSDGSKNLVSNTNCLQSLGVTSPIGNSGSSQAPTITCTTCVTTAGGQSIAGTTTFVNTSNTGTLSVTGLSSLGGLTVAPAATATPIAIQSGQNSGASGTVFTASSIPTPGATPVAYGVVEVDQPASSTFNVPSIYLNNPNTSGAATLTVKANASTDVLNIQSNGTCTGGNNLVNLIAQNSSVFSVQCNGGISATNTLTFTGSTSNISLAAHMNQSAACTGTSPTGKFGCRGTAASSSLTVTFAHAYSATPICVATDETSATALKVAPATGSVVITGEGASDVIDVICIGNGGT